MANQFVVQLKNEPGAMATLAEAHNPADGIADPDRDGYTTLEEFLNGTDPRAFVDYTDPDNNVNTL